MASGKNSKGVRFERGIPACLMAIDGTWRRACEVIEISDGSADLAAVNIDGLQLTEFFLLLSSVGVVYRRCRLDWVNGDRIGVSFISSARSSLQGKDEIYV